ncbi:hypothetical protein DMC63_15395 [Streptomyces sp. WAC 05977]|nr:hypothetical protein DMC63_15395 [Streptomyces sp. WAC 05977]
MGRAAQHPRKVAVLVVFGPGMLRAFGVLLVHYVQHPPKVKAGKAGGGTITFGGVWGRRQLRSWN